MEYPSEKGADLTIDWFEAPNASTRAEEHVGASIMKWARAGDAKKLQELVEFWSGNPVIDATDSSDETKKTALMWSSQFGHMSCVLLLCRAHASLSVRNKAGTTALLVAAEAGQHACMNILIAAGSDINQTSASGGTAANIAASRGHDKCLQLLIKSGADVNIANNNGYTPINNAAESRRDSCIRILLKCGADFNKSSKNAYSPVCTASLTGSLPCLDLLLKAGADFKTPCNTGATPLYLAANSGHASVLIALIGANADINASKTDGSSPTFIASLKGFDKCLELLINAKADLNAVHTDGRTPAYAAANAGHTACLELLITAGVDINKKEKDGWSPISAARIEGQQSCVDLLLRANAVDSGPPVYQMDPYFSSAGVSTEWRDESSVDEMKIQTMYKMVNECKVIAQGKEVLKKVLYLTNKQALLFDDVAMGRCVQALDLGEPKFVIKLLPSLGVHSQMKIAHPESYGYAETEFGDSIANPSEIGQADERIVETQILLFMKTCILPLAKQTRALILVSGANDCFLSVALSNIALAEQARLGKDCPFTVVATASEQEVHSKAVSPNDQDSVAAQIVKGSRSWMKNVTHMNNFYSHKYLRSGAKMSRCDLTSAASRYIIFEDYDEGAGTGDHPKGTLNSGPRRAFESIFLQHLTRKLPSIAIQSFSIGEGMQFLADLTSRNIPVLLLDATERAITMRRQLAAVPMTLLAVESDAFPSISNARMKSIRFCDGFITPDSRVVLLEIAQEMICRKWQVLIERGVLDSFSASAMAFLHSALLLGADKNISGSSSSANEVPLYLRVLDLEKLERTNKDSKKNFIPPELAMRAINFLHSRNNALKKLAELSKVEKWIKNHDKKFEHLMSLATNWQRELKPQCEDIIERGGVLSSYELLPAELISHLDVLTSPNTYSGSIFDIDGIKQILGSVAKIDRLPSANSLEALRILQDSWDHVEIYHIEAGAYKIISKVTYVFMLLTGVLITVAAVAEVLSSFQSRFYIIALSFIGTAVASYVSFTNPAIKWQSLRMAALGIESEIWAFRTRAGPYRSSGEGFDDSPERHLSFVLADIKGSVLEGADLKSTSFYSRTASKNLHGQHFNTNAGFGIFEEVGDKPVTFISSILGVPGPSSVALKALHGKVTDMDISPPPVTTVKRKPPHVVHTPMTAGNSDKYGGDTPLSLALPGPGPGVGESKFIEVVQRLSLTDAGGAAQQFRDAHYEPVQPDQYIRFRVAKALAFYKARIPTSNRTKNVSQVLLVLGSISSGVLAIAYMPILATIVSIFTAAITAYLEFSGTNSKIHRYSFTVHALQELIVWWTTLSPIDRHVVANIDRLVLTCEELLQREQQAWRSTSQTVRLLQKASVETAGNNQSSN